MHDCKTTQNDVIEKQLTSELSAAVFVFILLEDERPDFEREGLLQILSKNPALPVLIETICPGAIDVDLPRTALPEPENT